MAQKPTYHKISRLAFCKLQDWKRKSDKGKCSFVAQGRDEATRTPDPYVPNVVRYQLRYIPKVFFAKKCIFISFLLKDGCKGIYFFLNEEFFSKIFVELLENSYFCGIKRYKTQIL